MQQGWFQRIVFFTRTVNLLLESEDAFYFVGKERFPGSVPSICLDDRSGASDMMPTKFARISGVIPTPYMHRGQLRADVLGSWTALIHHIDKLKHAKREVRFGDERAPAYRLRCDIGPVFVQFNHGQILALGHVLANVGLRKLDEVRFVLAILKTNGDLCGLTPDARSVTFVVDNSAAGG